MLDQRCHFWVQSRSDWLNIGKIWDCFRSDLSYLVPMCLIFNNFIPTTIIFEFRTIEWLPFMSKINIVFIYARSVLTPSDPLWIQISQTCYDVICKIDYLLLYSVDIIPICCKLDHLLLYLIIIYYKRNHLLSSSTSSSVHCLHEESGLNLLHQATFSDLCPRSRDVTRSDIT